MEQIDTKRSQRVVMKKKPSINKMLHQKRLHLNFKTLLSHYVVPVMFIGMSVIFLFMYIRSHYTSYSIPIIDNLIASSIFLLLGIVFFFIQNRRLKFNSIPIDLSKKRVVLAIEKTARERKWILKNSESGFYQFYTNGGFRTGSWGELITIIIDKDELHFNSICDPYNRPSLASYGQNKKHRKELYKNLEV